MAQFIRRILPLIILFSVAFLYTRPYFRPGFFSTHDGEWAIVRLSEMQREIKDRQIPPRFSDYLNHGFGYPLFSFTYPLPYYIGILFRMFHVSYVDTVKIIFILSVYLSALFMFLLGRELAGEFAGFISAFFYTIAPYRLVNMYVRGSIGESLSLAVFPLLLFVSLKYILKPSPVRLGIASLVFALLILTHNITALIFFPVWIAFLYVVVIAYFEDVREYTLRFFPPLIILGLGLSAYFFIPALLEKKYIILSQIKLANVADHFISLADYLISPWSYGIKPSYQLGWAHILGAIIGLFGIFVSNQIYRKKYLPYAVFTIVGIILLVFLAHPASIVFWRLPPLSWIDFPWRLLTVLTFFLAFAGMFLALHKSTKIIAVIIIALVFIFSLKFAKPIDYINKGDDYYATNDATTTSMDELMPVWVSDKPKNRYKEKVETQDSFTAVADVIYNSKSINFKVSAEQNTLIKVNTVYFPGWQFFVDKKNIPVIIGKPDGLIRLNIPSGDHEVTGKFSETPLRFWSNMITVVSLIVLSGLLLPTFFRRLRRKPA